MKLTRTQKNIIRLPVMLIRIPLLLPLLLLHMAGEWAERAADVVDELFPGWERE